MDIIMKYTNFFWYSHLNMCESRCQYPKFQLSVPKIHPQDNFVFYCNFSPYITPYPQKGHTSEFFFQMGGTFRSLFLKKGGKIFISLNGYQVSSATSFTPVLYYRLFSLARPFYLTKPLSNWSRSRRITIHASAILAVKLRLHPALYFLCLSYPS